MINPLISCMYLDNIWKDLWNQRLNHILPQSQPPPVTTVGWSPHWPDLLFLFFLSFNNSNYLFKTTFILDKHESLKTMYVSFRYRVFIKYCGVIFKYFKIFRTLAFLCFPSVSVCVYTHQTGRIPALQQNWQSLEKSQNFKEKHNI